MPDPRNRRRAFVLSGLLGALLAGGAAPARAEAVVELLTSQGCSSCPPADRLLADLAKRPGVIALSLPVDYWDHLGWKDTLAQAAFSRRQRAYATARGDQQVYTPQAVVNGAAVSVGSDRPAIETSLARAGRPGPTVQIAEDGDTVRIKVGAGRSSPAEIWVLPVAKAREVAIGRGENRSRSVTYSNVVRGFAKVGTWTGAPAGFEVPRSVARPPGSDAYAVVLQAADEEGPGAILAAARSPGF